MEKSANSGEHWLNGNRLKVYPRLLVVLFAVMTGVWLLSFKHMVDAEGNPFGNDFITFWGASLAALQGHAPDAYNASRIFAFEQVAVPASTKVFGWFYPPSFYVLVLPLAHLPYVAAYLLYIFSTLGFFVAVLRRVVRNSIAMWCLAGFSGVCINFMDGQNAFLTAGLAAAAILCLKRRPYLAGVLIGLLAIKPHLAILFPVALVAIGAWRSIVAAAVTACALMAAGTAVLGQATFKAWLGSIATAQMLLEQGGLPWQKMPTVFALVRLLHAPVRVAYGLHIAVAIAAAVLVWRVWRRSQDWQLRGAVLMAATFLISPYVFDYDLVWLAFPIAWLALVGVRDGWMHGERELLTLAWVLPLLMAPIASTTSLQAGPVVLIAMLWVVNRRIATIAVVTSADELELAAV